jgi:hypothetical protein
MDDWGSQVGYMVDLRSEVGLLVDESKMTDSRC